MVIGRLFLWDTKLNVLSWNILQCFALVWLLAAFDSLYFGGFTDQTHLIMKYLIFASALAVFAGIRENCWILILVGMLFAGGELYYTHNAQKTSAELVEMAPGWSTIIRFQSTDGKFHEETTQSPTIKKYKIGDQVNIQYLSAKPSLLRHENDIKYLNAGLLSLTWGLIGVFLRWAIKTKPKYYEGYYFYNDFDKAYFIYFISVLYMLYIAGLFLLTVVVAGYLIPHEKADIIRTIDNQTQFFIIILSVLFPIERCARIFMHYTILHFKPCCSFLNFLSFFVLSLILFGIAGFQIHKSFDPILSKIEKPKDTNPCRSPTLTQECIEYLEDK